MVKQFHSLDDDESQRADGHEVDDLRSPRSPAPKARNALLNIALIIVGVALIATIVLFFSTPANIKQDKLVIPQDVPTPAKPVTTTTKEPETKANTTSVDCPVLPTPTTTPPTTTTTPPATTTTPPEETKPSTTDTPSTPTQPSTAPLVKDHPAGANATSIPDMQEGWVFTTENSPLKELCAKTQWRKNIWLDNWEVRAGLVNVRSEYIAAIRWAIDAGIGFIIPKIGTRSRGDFRVFGVSFVGPDYFFDADYMVKMLQEHCPEMPIRHNADGIPGDKWYKSSVPYWTQYRPGTFRAHVDQLLKEHNYDPNTSGEVIISEQTPLWGWEFYNEFLLNQQLLNIVHFRGDMRELAKPLLEKLPPVFIGFHMRNENDEDWHDRGGVVEWFKKVYLENWSHVKTIYVATGEQTWENKLRDDMKALGYTVESKWTLTADNPNLAQTFRNNGFDQNAIVEHEILKRSTHFFGMAESSFSYGIAFLRGNESLANCGCTLQGRTDHFFQCCY